MSHSEPSPATARLTGRVIQWILVALITLVVAPAVGGFVLALGTGLYLLLPNPPQAVWLPSGAFGAVLTSYYLGLPLAVVGLVWFALLRWFLSLKSFYLAALSGLLSVASLICLQIVTNGLSAGLANIPWASLLVEIVILGIPAVLAAAASWWTAQLLHRLP